MPNPPIRVRRVRPTDRSSASRNPERNEWMTNARASAPRSIPVRREEIRFAKDNDEWTKDEKERTKRGKKPDEGSGEGKVDDQAEESKGKPRKGRETADSKVNRSAEADRQRRNRPRH